MIPPGTAITEPFPGLRPFLAQEAELFFGRDEQVEELLLRLASQRLLAVVGTSGSGKSSLVRAGLLPSVQRGYLGPPGSRWVIATVSRPGLDPLRGLAGALVQAFGMDTSQTVPVETALAKSSLGLVGFTRSHLQKDERLLVFVDQFEELFRYRRQSGDEGRIKSTAFVKLLLAATGHSELVPLASQEPIYVVLTMRSEYLGRCAQFRGLPEALNDSQFLVPQMSRDQLREAIEGPVALGGAEISGELVDRLLNDVGDDPDLLPVLQHALFRQWEASAESRAKGQPIDVPVYEHETIRGIDHALNLDAEGAFAQFKDDTGKQKIARRMFQRLVEPGAQDEETRRPTRLSEIARVCRATEGQVREVIKVFLDRGFVTLSDDPDPLVDISHESLIRQWQRLKKWVGEESESASVYRRLFEADVKRRSLYRGPDLAEALLWQERESPNSDWATRYGDTPGTFNSAIRFLGRSRRRQWLERGLVVAFVFGLALLAAVFYSLYRKAEEQKRVADSRRLAAAAQLNRGKKPDRALLLSIEAYNTAPTLEAFNELLMGLQASPGLLTFLYQDSYVYSVAFSPDGRRLASADFDGTVQLWDVATRRPLGGPLQEHKDQVYSVAFSPDGRMLASASYDKTVRLWDVATRQPLGEPLQGHTSYVESVAFSPDGRMLASASYDKTVRLWDVATRQPLGQPLQGHTNPVESVAFSPDGRMLASASLDETVRLWDVATRRPLGGPLQGQKSPLLGLAFSGDGRTLASASEDHTVQLWDVTTRQPLGEPLQGHTDPVRSVAFSGDGRMLASASDDKTVRLWDVATRQPLGEPLQGHTGSATSAAFSPDGRMLASASGDETVQLWDVATRQPLGEPLRGHISPVRSVAFSADGGTLASASDDETVRLWDVATRRPLGGPMQGDKSPVLSVAFSADGRMLASGSVDGTVQLWDVATRQPSGEPLQGHPGTNYSVYSVAFSPDGRILASASYDGTVWLWDVARRQPLGDPLQGHTDPVLSVAFSADGRMLASAGDDKTVRLWDVGTRQPLGEPLQGHTGFVNSVAFSPDGRRLASASDDKTVRLWDIDPFSWISRTCAIVNRNLSWTEWQQEMGKGLPYHKTCSALPPGKGVPQ